jgi:hypothetical protein
LCDLSFRFTHLNWPFKLIYHLDCLWILAPLFFSLCFFRICCKGLILKIFFNLNSRRCLFTLFPRMLGNIISIVVLRKYWNVCMINSSVSSYILLSLIYTWYQYLRSSHFLQPWYSCKRSIWCRTIDPYIYFVWYTFF